MMCCLAEWGIFQNLWHWKQGIIPSVIKNISRNLFPLLVELPLRVVVTILECCVTYAGVKLSIRSFVLFLQAAFMIQNLMS